MNEMNRIGKPSFYTCPACSGALWEIEDSNVLRFRCHTGHAFTAEDLVASQDEGIEKALYAALRALEESGRLAATVASRAHENDRAQVEAIYAAKAQEAERSAGVIREMLQREGARSGT